jgi:3-hydroxyisobutyrate dehydrogenase-like beta-hydroxyacid dehydrogenase
MFTEKVGFIGLGNMGMIMAKKLVEKALFPIVFDLRTEVIQEIVALGAREAKSAQEVAEASNVIISVVRDIPQTNEVLFGQDGVWEAIKRDSIIILSSSLSPKYCQEISDRAAAKGIFIIDAPVSAEARSFEPGKEWAWLTFMIGGDEKAVKLCWPVFEAMGKNLFYFGCSGSGMACKLVNNLAMYANEIVARECLNLGIKAGLDLRQMVQALSVSTGFSKGLSAVSGRLNKTIPSTMEPIMVKTNSQSIAEPLGLKDRRLALEMARDVGANTPVTTLMTDIDLDSIYDAYSKIIH